MPEAACRQDPLIWRFTYRAWRFISLFCGLLLWLSALLWASIAWVPLVIDGAPVSSFIIPLVLQLIILIPPLLFFPNWLAALASSFWLYGLAQWLLGISARIWGFAALSRSLGVPIVLSQSAIYYRETGDLEKAESKFAEAEKIYLASFWKYFSGACYGLFQFTWLLAKQGKQKQAEELSGALRLPLISNTILSCAWFASAAFIPTLVLTAIFVFFQDININAFHEKPADARIARLLPLVQTVESFYGPEGKEFWCRTFAKMYQETHTGQKQGDVLLKANTSTRVTAGSDTRSEREDYLIERWFWLRSIQHESRCRRSASCLEALKAELAVCDDHIALSSSLNTKFLSLAHELLSKCMDLYPPASKILPENSAKENQLVKRLLDNCTKLDKQYSRTDPRALQARLVLAEWLELKKGARTALPVLSQIRTDWQKHCDSAGRSNTRSASRFIQCSGLCLAYLLLNADDKENAVALADKINTYLSSPAYTTNSCIDEFLELSGFYRLAGEYSKARSIVNFAGLLSTKHAQEAAYTAANRQVQAKCLLEESRICYEELDYAESYRLAKLCNRNLLQSGKENTELLASSFQNMAQALAQYPDKISQAIEAEEQCLKIFRQTLGQKNAKSARAALTLAQLLRKAIWEHEQSNEQTKALAARAISLLQETLDTSRKFKTNQELALLYADTCLEYGYFAESFKNYEHARTLFTEACDLHMFLPGPSAARSKVEDLDNLARIDALQGNMALARNKVLKASDLLEAYLSELVPQLSLAEQIAFSRCIENHMSCLLAVSQNENSELDNKLLRAGGFSSLSSLKEPYKYLIRWKGFLLEQLRLRARASSITNDSQMKQLLAKHKLCSTRILELYAQDLPNEVNLHALERQKDEVERDINAYTRKQFRELAGSALDVSDLQRTLKESELYLDLYKFESFTDKHSRYCAILCTRNTLNIIALNKTDSINQAISQWRDNLLLPFPDRLISKEEPAAHKIHPWVNLKAQLLAPVSAAIPKSTKRIYISEQDELARLPWSVLFSEDGSESGIETCQSDSPRELIAIRASAGNLLESLPPANSQAAPPEILFVGGIDYGKRAAPLPGSQAEVKIVKAEAENAGLKTILLSDFMKGAVGKATEERVIAELSKCRLAHLATHGYFNESQELQDLFQEQNNSDIGIASRNPLLDSGLLVSSKKNGKAHEGFLTGEDILRANLSSCRLLVLSACETGRGRELNGQGVIGLRSSLMGAGAKCVILSLWKVPDLATTELMKVFYKRLFAGDTPVKALKEAQTAVRQRSFWKAPQHWAAWVIVGDGWQECNK